ncbi:unnamed protein product [Didymodactylos carnosus]|uniref:Uncharacterized protein n=1 Tax=Didymodactylos carnosus TaxID=1234261 RepID=A0A814MTP8_9BILA|nr:unnamed protein product [Didymodactylos carnosus]CAF1219267.1 unnamed protein product [Didymodactylos carnosus]CAF3849507.1 unnamed protein product [Didymodactylos carnosus]CAF4027455.1 unnamed protein product [Didymodactylos carnosus]
MFAMPKNQCHIQDCTRSVATLCYCCQKNVCSKHFNEHIEVIKGQLHPLVEQRNELAEKVHNLKIEQLTDKAYEDLDQWRTGIYKMIDDIYSKKRKEIEQSVQINEALFVKHKNEQLEKIEKVKLDLEQLISQDDATADQIRELKSSLQIIEMNLAVFQRQFIVVQTRLWDVDLVQIQSGLNMNFVNSIGQRKQKQQAGGMSYAHQELEEDF